MFDFEHWREWLSDQAVVQRQAGLRAEFHLGKLSSKPGYSFSLRTDKAIAELRIWVTGEADWDVMDASSSEFVDHKWDMTLNDENFESLFREFLACAGRFM